VFRYSKRSNIRSVSRFGEARLQQSARHRPNVCLMLEQLEDRVVPSGGNLVQPVPFPNTCCAQSSAVTANQMMQKLEDYTLKLSLQLHESAQSVLSTLSAVRAGQQPLSNLVPPLVQFFELFTAVGTIKSVLPPLRAPGTAAEAPSVEPLAGGATDTGESFAASTPSVLGD
jgi:hypothetical protein